MGAFEIFVIVLVVLLVVTVIASAIIVPQGYHYTVERLGRYVRTLTPGLRLVIPFVERIGQRLNMMEQVLDVPRQDVITRDNAVVDVDAVAFYQILDAALSAYQVDNLELAMHNLILTNIRTVMGSMDLDELLSNRDQINSRLLSIVDEATAPWGVKVNRIEIRDIEPPKDIVMAMARQLKAERDKRALVLDAEGARQSHILRAEGLKQSQILEAEGRREAAFRDAEAREREAEAEAKATEMVSKAIATGNLQAVNYFIASKYVEALKELAKADNQKVLMMPVEAASLIGSIGGIAELTRESFASRAKEIQPAPESLAVEQAGTDDGDEIKEDATPDEGDETPPSTS